MKETERIQVYIRVIRGTTVCICPQSDKGCGCACQTDIVTRDRYDGWRQTMRRDRYGK